MRGMSTDEMTDAAPESVADPRNGQVHLRPRQIAVRHNVSERTVHRWIADGKVEAVRVNRSVFVTVESVERLFRAGR
jgi:excisionase family DNA binding protein